MKISRTFRLERFVILLLEELSQGKQFDGNNTKALEHAILRLAENQLGIEKVKEILYKNLKD